MTKQTFCKKLFILAEMFDVPMSGEKAEIYWERLKDYDDQQLEKTFGRILDTCKFFPKIAEIKELIEGSPADKSLQAWHISLEAIRNKSPQFEDKRIVAVISDMGGWQEFCRIADTKGLYLKEKGFREKYQYYFRQPIPSNISINIADNSLRIGYADEPVYKRA